MRVALASLQVGVLLLAGLAVAVDLQLAPRLPWPVLVQERPAAPPENALLEYRVEQAEKAIVSVRHEHTLLTYLLVGNLVGVLASLATYLLVGRKRSRSG